MRGLRELVFSTSNQCPAHCQDCPIVHDDNPRLMLSAEQMMQIVDEVHEWGTLLLVVFTGGEPFLLGDDLFKIVAYVAEKGLLTRIVTNAYWATSKSKAIEVLSKLKTLGLSEINVSCDDYHQEFIPLKNVKYANEAAIEVGMPLLIGSRRKPGGKITVEYLSKYLGVTLHLYKEGEKNPANNIILSTRNVPLYSGEPFEIAENNSNWTGACDSILSNIIISPDRRVQICCGIATNTIPELYIGSLADNDLLSILKRGNQDLIANWLALEGPSSILSFVRSKAPEIDLPEQYVNRCHLCNTLFTRDDVRSILQTHAHEKRNDILLMRGLLDWVSENWAPSLEHINPTAYID